MASSLSFLFKLSTSCEKFIHKWNFQVLHKVYFSTEAATVPVQQTLSHFRTFQSDPIFHTYDQEAKFYTLPQNIVKKLFNYGGIPRQFETQAKAFTETCVMIRRPALEVMAYLKNADYSLPAIRYVIYGRNGTGKTLTLVHLIHYAHNAKFLILHMPWARIWTKRPKEIEVSLTYPGRVNHTFEALLWLQQFKSQNSELLEQLNLQTSQTYTWTKREITEQGEPLTNVINHGLNRIKHASDCVAVILKEIKLQSQSNKFRTLVVVDGVNALFSKLNIKRPDRSLVTLEDVTVLRAFKKLFRNDWTNAAIVVTVDPLAVTHDGTISTPKALLQKEGFESFDPFVPILVNNYTDKEIESTLDYYIDRLWIQDERGRTQEGKEEIKHLSGFNPYDLMHVCAPL